MGGAREEILARIRGALGDVPAWEGPDDVTVARAYRRAGELDGAARLALLEDRLRDYNAEVQRVTAAALPAAIRDGCRRWGVRSLVVPPVTPQAWRPPGIEVADDDGHIDAHRLDEIDGALTGCAVAIAQTGTIVLDGQGLCGRRIVTLVPDHHICVVESGQVVELVPEAIAAVAPAVRDSRSPITLVSGPSASSDIELERVEGVHGPRHLLVLLVAEAPTVVGPP